MSLIEAPPRGRSTVVEWTCVAVLVLAVAGFGVTTLPGFRETPGFIELYDGWLQGGAYVACALVAIILAARASSGRLVWGLLALALTLWAGGYVLSFAWVRWQTPPPYPSISDGLWLSCELTLLVVLLLRARVLVPRMPPVLRLDAVAGALVATGVALTVLSDVLRASNPPGISEAARLTNLAFPVLDITLLALSVGLLAGCGLRPSRSDLALLLGIVAFSIEDVIFLVRLYLGVFGPGQWFQVFALTVTALLALASLAGRRAWHGDERRHSPRDIAVTTSLATAVTAFFVYASFEPVPTVSTLVMAAALMLTIVRGASTLLADRTTAGVALRASHEELLRFRSLVDTSQDFIAIAGMDGQVMYVNPAGRDMVGAPRDADLSVETIADFLTEEGIRASIEIEQPAVVAHGYWEGESTLLRRDGQPPIPVAISSFLMHDPRTGEPFALATVQRDISERRAGERLVADLARQRELLLARLVRAQEDERAQIAADVHDDSVQALAAVDLRLGLLRRKVAESENAELVDHLDKALEAVRGATARLRHLLFDLESPALTSGLDDALNAAAHFVFEDTGVAWEITGDRQLDLPTLQRVAVYRIVMEALSNVRTHAQADHVQIALSREDNGVLVTIVDDGVGMTSPIQHRPGHRGLASSRDRAAVAGGWLAAEGSTGGGTRVSVWLPEVGPVAGVDLDEEDRMDERPRGGMPPGR